MIVAAIVVIVGLLVGGGLALFSGSGTTSVSPSAPISPAARSVLGTALAAAERAGSFHYVGTSKSANGTFTTVGDATTNGGRQQITTHDSVNGTAVFNVIVAGTTAYFRGDQTAMEENLNVSPAVAAAHANQWISLAPSDGSVYYSVYAAVNTRDALKQNVSFKPQALGSTTSGGKKVQTVTGTLVPVNIPGQGTENISGTGTLQVAPGTNLPMRYVQSGFSGKQRTTFTMTLGNFGEPVDTTPPSGALSYASIGGPTGGSGGSSPTPTYLT